jgi:hypothetical protein
MSLPPLRLQFISIDKDEPAIQVVRNRWETVLKKAMNRRNQILCKSKAFSIREAYMDGIAGINGL